MRELLRDSGGAAALLALTLWVALAALVSLVVRVTGAPRLKQYPFTLAILGIALLAVPAAGLFKISRPITRKLRPFIQHTQSPAIQSAAGCAIFPSDNIWNTSIRNLPLDSMSSAFIERMNPGKPVHADFGPRAGYEFTSITADEQPAKISFSDGAAESDPGPYRIPDSAPIEPESDHHLLALDMPHCELYELFAAEHTGPHEWRAGSAAIFDLRSNKLRPSGWTSADAAGLPILPGLVRYDEVKAGAIRHALRFTTPDTRNTFVWPARHRASSKTDPALPPMGQRFRLKASFDTTQFSPDTRVILTALQDYGMFLADNGGAWFLSGAKDSRWPSRVNDELKLIHGSDFEAVDSSALMLDPDSARVRD
jgi:hypothetical protein